MRQSKRIAINALSSWGGIFANAAVLIFLTKFLLNRLSSEEFGMLRYVITMQGSLIFLDLGLGVALNRFVSRFLATKEVRRLNATISLIFLLYLGLGTVAGLAMTGLGLLLPSLITGCTAELYASGFWLMVCMGAALAMRFWGYAPRGVLWGIQRYDIVTIILAVGAVLRAGADAFVSKGEPAHVLLANVISFASDQAWERR